LTESHHNEDRADADEQLSTRGADKVKDTTVKIGLSEHKQQKSSTRNEDSMVPKSNFNIDVELIGTCFENLDQILESERFAGYKNRNLLTIPQATQDQIDFYRLQETERYKHPQKPWVYI